MRSAFKQSTFMLCLAWLAILPLPAREAALTPESSQQEFSKVIKKEFDISAEGTTSLANKYGTVAVKTWDRERVKISVTIVVNAKNEAAAEEVFERIRIDFSNSPDYVSAETQIGSKKGGWLNWSGDDKSDYRIDYEVFLPATNQLKLSNKYGNAVVGDMEGRGEISVKYGNFEIGSLGEDSEIYLGYGKGTLERAGDLRMEVSYSNLNLKEVKDVYSMTKYSKVRIERAGDIEAESKYDNYRLGEIRDFSNLGKYDNIDIELADKVEVSSKYTNVTVGRLTRTLDLDLQYGGGRVKTVSSGFSEITLEGHHSDFKIMLSSDCSYQMDASSNYAGISYPSDMEVEYEVEKGTSSQVKGRKGSSGGVIRARLNYGGLKVAKN